MAETNEQDLWPEGFQKVGEDSPLEILRQQANLLAGKTGDLVRAEIEDTTSQFEDILTSHLSARFILVAPAMGGYRFVLFRVRYPVVGYPVEIFDAPFEDIFNLKADTPAKLREVLSHILRAPETQRIIGSLMRECMARISA